MCITSNSRSLMLSAVQPQRKMDKGFRSLVNRIVEHRLSCSNSLSSSPKIEDEFIVELNDTKTAMYLPVIPSPEMIDRTLFPKLIARKENKPKRKRRAPEPTREPYQFRQSTLKRRIENIENEGIVITKKRKIKPDRPILAEIQNRLPSPPPPQLRRIETISFELLGELRPNREYKCIKCPKCSRAALADLKHRHGQCGFASCAFEFCNLCSMPYHPCKPCRELREKQTNYKYIL